jgi:hypothetical protein
MWVFVAANDKVYDGTLAATAKFRGDPTVGGIRDISLTGGAINFVDKNVGPAKAVTFSGYSISGTDSPAYALFAGAGSTTAAITAAPLTVTANNAAKTYGDAPTFAGSAFTSSGLVNGETIASVTETSPGAVATASVAGSPYAITPSNAVGGSFSPSNYSIGYVGGILTVTPAPLTVTANNAAKTYGDVLTLAGSAFTSSGLVNGETIGSVTETSPGAVATASVGGSPYTIAPSNAVGGSFTPSNYSIGYVGGVLTVTPAPLTVTANNAAKTYGNALTFAGSAFTSSGLVNGDTIGSVTEISPGAVATASVAGSPYAITPSNAVGGSFTPSNYSTNYADGVLTIAPASLTVTANNAAKTYGDALTFAGSAFTSSGLVNGDTIGSVTETSPGAAPTASVASSPYAITPSNAVGGSFTPSNYSIGYGGGVLTVTPTSDGGTPGPVVVPPTTTGPVVIVSAPIPSPVVVSPTLPTPVVVSPTPPGPVGTLPLTPTPVGTGPVGASPALNSVVASPFTAGGLVNRQTISDASDTGGGTAASGDAAVVITASAGLNLAVIGNGVRMPILQLAGTLPVQSAPSVAVAASPKQEAQNVMPVPMPLIQPAPAALPRAAEIGPYKSPVYPRKQARH